MFHAIPVSASVGISLVISVASITGSDGLEHCNIWSRSYGISVSSELKRASSATYDNEQEHTLLCKARQCKQARNPQQLMRKLIWDKASHRNCSRCLLLSNASSMCTCVILLILLLYPVDGAQSKAVPSLCVKWQLEAQVRQIVCLARSKLQACCLTHLYTCNSLNFAPSSCA